MEFFSSLYELWGNFALGDFSNDMFHNGIYSPVGITMLISACVWMLLYYYAINNPRWAKVTIWLLWLVALGALNFIFAYSICYAQLSAIYEDQGQEMPSYWSDIMTFSFENGLISMITAAVISLIIKGKSSVLKNVPF